MPPNSGTYLRAICHPPPTTDPTYRGWFFRADEITKKSERAQPMTDYIGKPVCVNHDKSKVVGRVEALHRSSKGDILCDLWIDDSTPLGRKTLEDLRTQRLSEVSIGFKSLTNELDYAATDLRPSEISLVPKGAIPNSKVLHFNIGNRLYHSVSAMKQFTEDISPPPPQTINQEMQTTAIVPDATATTVDPFVTEFGMTKEDLKAVIARQKTEQLKHEEALQSKIESSILPWLAKLAENKQITTQHLEDFGKATSTLQKSGQTGEVVIEALAAASENHKLLEEKYQEIAKREKEQQDKITKLEETIKETSKVGLQTQEDRSRRTELAFKEKAKSLAGQKEVDAEASATSGQKRSLSDQFKYEAKRIREAASQIKVEELA